MVKLGIIGSGGMAEHHAKRFSEINECRLWACKDQHAEHAQNFAIRFNIPYWYTDIDNMLGDSEASCDAFSCAVLDERHSFIGQKLLNSRKPLMMEKPLTRTLKEAEQLMKLVYEIQVPNFINFSKRNTPALWALYNLLKSNYLGSVQSIRAEYLQSWVATQCWGDWMKTPRWKWRLQPQTSTAGIIGDLGSHIIDTLLLLFGNLKSAGNPQILRLEEAMNTKKIPFRKLDASFYDTQGTVPVHASVDFAVLSDKEVFIPGTIHLSWIDQNAVDSFRIIVFGEKRYALLDLGQSKNQIYLYDLNHNIEEIINYPMVPTTYELFIQTIILFKNGEKFFNKNNLGLPISDFHQGYLVQKKLHELFPGVLPL